MSARCRATTDCAGNQRQQFRRDNALTVHENGRDQGHEIHSADLRGSPRPIRTSASLAADAGDVWHAMDAGNFFADARMHRLLGSRPDKSALVPHFSPPATV